jgi:hypothetical protein
LIVEFSLKPRPTQQGPADKLQIWPTVFARGHFSVVRIFQDASAPVAEPEEV